MKSHIEAYKYYINNLQDRVTELEEKEQSFKQSRNSIINLNILTKKDNISNFKDINFSTLDDEKSVKYIVEDLELKSSIIKITKINAILGNIRRKINELMKYVVPMKVYRSVIAEFYIRIFEKIKTGYRFNLGHRLGIHYLKVSHKSPRSIHWQASIKNRDAIIARGGTPYKVTERDQDNKIVADNGGEKWLQYWTGDEAVPRLMWKKGIALTNAILYSFRPNRTLVLELGKWCKQNPNWTLNIVT